MNKEIRPSLLDLIGLSTLRKSKRAAFKILKTGRLPSEEYLSLEGRKVIKFYLESSRFQNGICFNNTPIRYYEKNKRKGLRSKDMNGTRDGEKEIWMYTLNVRKNHLLQRSLREGNWQDLKQQLFNTIYTCALTRGELLKVFVPPNSLFTLSGSEGGSGYNYKTRQDIAIGGVCTAKGKVSARAISFYPVDENGSFEEYCINVQTDLLNNFFKRVPHLSIRRGFFRNMI